MITNQEALNDIKGVMYNTTEGKPYGIVIAHILLKIMPKSTLRKLIKCDDEESTGILTKDVAINFLSEAIPNILPEDKFRELLHKSKDNTRLDLEEIYSILNVESILDVAGETNIQLIAEAEDAESAGASVKKLSDILDKNEIPNVLQIISKTVEKGILDNNKELEKIEDKETELIVKTDPNIDLTSSFGSIENEGGINENEPGSSTVGNEAGIDTGNSNSYVDGSTNGEGEASTDEGETNEELAGEEGELYAESIVSKYTEELATNILYNVKNAVSKYMYAYITDMNGEREISIEEKYTFALLTYALVTLGYILDRLNMIMDMQDFIMLVNEKLRYKGEGDTNVL